MNGLPPPLPKSAGELDIVLGMTAQRVAFHYGIELEGLKYNGPELGGLRRRMKPGAKVEITFDPGDLGHINVFDPLNETYFRVPAVNQGYAKGLSLWQHKVIRRYAQRQLNTRTNIVALAQARAEIRALVERDFNRKSTRCRKRHARFMENHASSPSLDQATNQPTLCLVPDTPRGHLDVFADDEILPVFEAALDLPRPSAPMAASINGGSATGKTDD
jgi:putative transposase